MPRPLPGATLAALLVLAPPVAAQTSVTGRAADLRIGGRLHAQYAASSVESADNDFFFRRARLIADVTIGERLGGRLQTDFAGGDAQVQDAYLSLQLTPTVEVSLGQFKRAFDLFELSSSTELSLIERDGRVDGVGGCPGVGGLCSYSRLTEKLGYAGRDQGIRVDGVAGPAGYMLTLTNGTGIDVGDENDAKSLSGLVAFPVSDTWSLGLQVAAHDYVGPDDATDYGVAWAVDAEHGTWRDGVHVQAGFATGDNWQVLDADGGQANFRTAQVMATIFYPRSGTLVSGWEPLGRLSWADADTDAADDGAFVLTPGAMVYLGGRNKIGVNLDIALPERGDTEYSLKVQSFLYF